MSTKGQLISKAIYGLLTSPKNQTDEFFFVCFFTFQVRPFVLWENLESPNCSLVLSDIMG